MILHDLDWQSPSDLPNGMGHAVLTPCLCHPGAASQNCHPRVSGSPSLRIELLGKTARLPPLFGGSPVAHDCQELRFICIPNLDDVPVARAIGQFEDVGSRGQDLPGDFHRIVESNNGFSVPLIRSSARGEYGAQQHRDQHSTHCKYNYSQSLHATTLLVGSAGPNGQGWRLRMKLGRPKPATRTEPCNRAVLPGLRCLLPRSMRCASPTRGCAQSCLPPPTVISSMTSSALSRDTCS